MAIRYKTTTKNGKPILSHRKVWEEHYGPIPDGYHIHHKNGDRFDNRIENLECLSPAEHAALHHTGTSSWNKGIEYGKTEAYKKSNQNRRKNYARKCKETFDAWEANDRSAKAVAELLGISRRQVYSRLQSFAEHSTVC